MNVAGVDCDFSTRQSQVIWHNLESPGVAMNVECPGWQYPYITCFFRRSFHLFFCDQD